MKTVTIITSRWGSKRLKGKALIPICGKPLLQHIVDAARGAKNVDAVIVSTTTKSQPIIDYCREHKIAVSVYPLDEDVLTRLCMSGKVMNADIVVYLWGDAPLIQSKDIEAAVEHYKKGDVRYASYETKYGVIAVTSLSVLMALARTAFSMQDREYVHDTLLAAAGLTTESPHEYLTVDTKADIKKVEEEYELLQAVCSAVN